MKILHVTVGLTVGGAERAMVELAREQKKRGHEVRVWAVRRGGPFADALDDAEIPYWFPKMTRAVPRVTEVGRDWVVHSALFWADLTAVGFARARRARCVATFQNVWSGYEFAPWQGAVATRLYRKFDALTAVSNEALASFSDRDGTLEGTVIPNPATAIPGDTEARALKVHDRVTFFGDQRDIYSFYLAADVLLMPSLVEGLPLVALEAINAGLPIVASEAGGLKTLLAHAPVPAGPMTSPDVIALKVRRALEDPAPFREWAKAARAAFQIESICDRYDEVYRSLAGC